MTFAHMQAFLDKTRGQITLGEIPPVERARLSQLWERRCTSRAWAAMVRRWDKLLERLDTALGKMMGDKSVIDEVLPEIKRRIWRARSPATVTQLRSMAASKPGVTAARLRLTSNANNIER